MTELRSLGVGALRRAISIKEQISKLETELAAITDDNRPAKTELSSQRTMSAVAKARIAAAQRARWARIQAEKGETRREGTGSRRKMTSAARAKIAAAARARWARAKAAGKSHL